MIVPFSHSRRIAVFTSAVLLIIALAACSRPETGGTAAASVLTVEVIAPGSQRWPDSIEASGPLTAWQEGIVSPETGGLRIAELAVDVGDSVRRGQVLARLADASVTADLRKQEALVAKAQAELRQARSNVARAKVIESSGGLSAQQIEEYRVAEATASASLSSANADLENARLRLRQTRIVAPDDGLVSSRTGVLGNVVNTGAELYRLIRQGRIEWQPELDPDQLSRVREGQPARVTLPDGTRVEGRVRLVEPTLSTATGRGSVHVHLPGDSGARAGMFASGNIETGERVALTLPQAAVVMRDGRAYVYVVGADNRVNGKPVKTGRRRDDAVEIVSGIDAKARVVASGGAFLSEGATVTVVQAEGARDKQGAGK